ncbi:hypothetical protein ID866_519 [Astraeus odoratus]|nr:hypothetical protein ID866_519 [Astraeus odoratus]
MFRSSRESSPVTKRPKRTFTPPSDDGDLVPAINGDESDVPSQEAAPLIRKPVGFSYNPPATAHIETYEATLPSELVNPCFLPGQAPPPPPKPPKQQKPKSSRKKKDKEYSAQTGRFRLMAPPAGVPPLTQAPADSRSLVPPVGSDTAMTPFHSAATNAGSPEGTLSSGNSVTGLSPPNLPTHLPLSSSATLAMSSLQPYRNGITMHANVGTGLSYAHTVAPASTSAASAKSTKRKEKPTGAAARDDASSPQVGCQPAPQAPPSEMAVAQMSYSTHGYGNYTGRMQAIGGNRPTSTDNTPGSPLNGTLVSPSTAKNTSGKKSSFASHLANISQAPPRSNSPNTQRPLRMVTLLIEDLRSGIPDSQLAEIKVPLKVAEDPEDGFWADAVDVCNALQASPSRIDGPAKVFTMRAKFRQFFMRVDHYDNHQVTPAHLGVSKQRTLDVFVEAPPQKGQFPGRPSLPDEGRPGQISDSESDSSSLLINRPQIRVPTRDEQIEALSKINYTAPRGRVPSGSDASYSKRKRGGSKSPSFDSRNNSPRKYRRSQYTSSQESARTITPPSMPSQAAETEEEKNEAIVKWIKPQVESHKNFIQYMQSRAKLQRVSEVLEQYKAVAGIAKDLAAKVTPTDLDGAPNCMVDWGHILQALDLDPEWGERCLRTLGLLAHYGSDGNQYKDPRVIDMINDTTIPKPDVMEKFWELLETIHHTFNSGTVENASSRDSNDR